MCTKQSVQSYASYLPDEYPRCAHSGHTRSLPRLLCLLSKVERHELASKTFLQAEHPCLFRVRSCLHSSSRSIQRWHRKVSSALAFRRGSILPIGNGKGRRADALRSAHSRLASKPQHQERRQRLQWKAYYKGDIRHLPYSRITKWTSCAQSKTVSTAEPK